MSTNENEVMPKQEGKVEKAQDKDAAKEPTKAKAKTPRRKSSKPSGEGKNTKAKGTRTLKNQNKKGKQPKEQPVVEAEVIANESTEANITFSTEIIPEVNPEPTPELAVVQQEIIVEPTSESSTQEEPKAEPQTTEQEAISTEVAVNTTEPAAQSKQIVKEQESIKNKKQQNEANSPKQQPAIPALPNITINNIVELLQAPQRSIILTDQQIQQLSLEEIDKRYRFLESTLVKVLDYDVVISDTNIWLELLIGYSSSHSDPRYNARLQFERQLEFISKLTHYRGGKFMIVGETYEEIERFAALHDPTNHKDADFTDNTVCLNAAARLAKKLILVQQRENRMRIDRIAAESHHASFADPAIIKKVADLFAEGKKVLLLTNDTSVGIRAMGICDDLQRINNISDEEWDELYAPLRPMVFTFDDLKQLDFYTRQYHYMQIAAGVQWMQYQERKVTRIRPEGTLELWQEAFRPGDKHRGDNLFVEPELTQTNPLKQQTRKQQQSQQANQPAKKQNNTKKQNSTVTNVTEQTPVVNEAINNAPTPQKITENSSEQKPQTTEPSSETGEQPKSKSRSRRKSQRKNTKKEEENVKKEG